MKNVDVTIDGKRGVGIEVALPKAPLVLIHGAKGFVMCGYLSIETADKLEVAAAVVRGVSTVDDVLKANIVAVSKAAEALGVKVGMAGKDALAFLL